jgi:DNA-binding NtrC family response regulator
LLQAGGTMAHAHRSFVRLRGYPSAVFNRVLERATLFAREGSVPILIEGESGTGKTAMARYIHDESPRAKGPFHTVVVCALDNSLIASALFGHVKGAFTDARSSRAGHFVSANGGTIFLDEIGKASPEAQQNFLDTVETGRIRPLGSDLDLFVDVRTVAATNVPLESLVELGLFLPDLWSRLKSYRLRIPPLRERRADIPELVEELVARHAESCGYSTPPRIHPDLMAALTEAEWRYNLREIDDTMHRLLIEARGATELTPSLCTDDLAFLAVRRPKLTRAVVEQAVCDLGSVTLAAEALGYSRASLYRLGIRKPVEDPDASAG